MMTPLVIVGCGGFGREIQDIVEALNTPAPVWDFLGYLDDAPSEYNKKLVQARGSQILGPISWVDAAPKQVRYVIGIGVGSVRRRLDMRFTAAGFTAATLVHPSATCGHAVQLKSGVVVCAGVRMTNNISLGRHVHLNLNSTVGHDCELADYVTVSPLVAVSGGVKVGRESMLGTHSAILQNLTIGAKSIIGAGACVIKDVPDDAVVKGVPAR